MKDRESSSDSSQSLEDSSSVSDPRLRKVRPDKPVVPLPPTAKSSNPSVEMERQIMSIPKQLNIVKEAKPRLVIDHLILENFKSYAGSQKIGSFHSNFTSIVGPNGSGKSNLIESMLFIFGFNARWMRLTKLNQLIHNSSSMMNVGRAAVEVHFKKVIDDGERGVHEAKGSQFFIRRTVNSSSISKYYLDGQESTQGEVKTRLKLQGIDLDCERFLILQGEVEMISQMKQKSGDSDKPGLLEYLQQIIGSSVFIEKIEASLKEYNQTEEEKHEKGQLMKVIQNELKGMSKGKEDAVRYVKKEKKIYQFQNVLAQVLISNSKDDLQKCTAKLVELEKTAERVLNEQRERLKAQGERVRQFKKNKAEIEDLQKAIDKQSEQMAKMNQIDKNITHEISFKCQDQIKFEKQLSELDKALLKIMESSTEIKNKLPEKSEIWRKMNAKVESLKEALSKHDKPHLRQQIKDIEMEIKKNKLTASTFESKLDSCQQNYKKLNASKEDYQVRINQLTMTLNKHLDVNGKILTAQRCAEDIRVKQRAKIAELTKNRQNVSSELAHIETALRDGHFERQESGQFNNMFKEIMKLKINGVLGRLGDLGTVNKEYDEIITTCCPRLDNIVVKDYEAASAVIKFLKESRLGRATCIILDKISDFKNYMAKQFHTPPNSVRLFDVVNPANQDAKLAFYFALNDTLYCQNSDLGLEYAMKSEQQRRRVISKKAQGYIIYEMNGLMIGSQAKKGGFQVKGRQAKGNEDNSKELEQFRKNLQSSIEAINKNLRAEEQAYRTATDDIEQMRQEVVGVQESIRQHNEEIQELKSLMGKAGGKSKSEQVGDEIKAIQTELENLVIARKKLDGKLKEVEQEQGRSESKEVGRLREEYKQLKEQFLTFEKMFQKQKAILETTAKRVNENKANRAATQKDIDFLKNEVDKLKKQQKEVEKSAAELIGKVTGYSQRLQQCQAKAREWSTVLKQDEKEVKESKDKVDRVKKDVENCKELCRKADRELKNNENNLTKIRVEYREITASYDFMESIDEIERMALASAENRGNPIESSSSMLQSSLLRDSIDSSLLNSSKSFPIERLLKIDPQEDLSEEGIDVFLAFVDRMSGLIVTQRSNLKKMEGSNIEIINEYRHKYHQYKERLSNFEQVKLRMTEVKKVIDNLKESRLKLFREGFGVINSKLKEVYQYLTKGGDAELELIDSLDPFSDGVNFSVRPPKKSWKEVNKLSGGEKTLSSLSLIFALHYFKPTPLYFMDEIDAALDFKNVQIVADYIKKRTKDAQFIIISLRTNMFEEANKLVGVYKTNDKTRVINLDCTAINAARDRDEEKQKENMNIFRN